MRRIRQITVRGLDPRLQEEISRLAEEQGISLNKAALRILKKGAGLQDRSSRDVIGKGLDALIGTWSEGDEKEFNRSIRSCEQIDRRFWK